MKKCITQELIGSWETWIVEVPDGTTDEQIKSGEVQPQFLELNDSGFDGHTITTVTEWTS